MKRRYRPRRLLRRPRPAAGKPRRPAALLLCLCLVLALVPPLARAAGYDVSFFNYDMTPMEGNGYVYSDVPEGAALYTAEELAEVIAEYNPRVAACQRISDAVEQAYLAAGKDDVILAFGSLSFLGELTRQVSEYRERMRC